MVRLCLDEVIEVEGIVRLLVHVGEQKGVSVFLCKISSRGRGGGSSGMGNTSMGPSYVFHCS